MESVPVTSLVGEARELAEYSADGFGRRVLGVTDRMAILLAGFRAGQEIPVHAPDVDLAASVLDGDGLMRLGERVQWVRTGDVAVIPAGEARGVRAGTGGMVMMVMVSPPPTSADHTTGRVDCEWPADSGSGRTVAQMISAEHRGLREQLEDLGSLADQAARLDDDERTRRLSEAVEFLRHDLLPHARTEEASVYPAAEKVLRARGGAVRTMTMGHETITALLEELEEALTEDDVTSLPRILHSLRAITLLHLDEEEEVYLPALAALSPEEGKVLELQLGEHH